jgi:CubicO group peptidase (beta-lactamase class C family)/peptidoglycan/LPS O-acetylase OafA/YrhL
MNRRLVAFDVIRAAALVRIFLWHATGWAALTWIGAIPAMFFVAGVFAAAGIEAHGYRGMLINRLRRVMPPYWVFAAVVVGVIIAAERKLQLGWHSLGWLIPVVEPPTPVWEGGWAIGPLWYIRTYLWLCVLAGVLYIAVVRRVSVLLAALAIGVFWLEVVHGTGLWELQRVVAYAFFFAMGMGWRTKTILATRRSIATWAVGGLTVAAAASWWMMPANLVVNDSHTLTLGVGVFWVAVLTASLERFERVGGWARKAVAGLNRRSLTIYLYHAPLTGLSYAYLTSAWQIRGQMALIGGTVLGAIMTWAAVAVAGVFEDLAAGRRNLRISVLGSGVAVALVAGALLLPVSTDGGLVVHEAAALPPAPSKAPAKAVLDTPQDMEFLVPPAPSHAGASAQVETPSGPKTSEKNRKPDRPTETIAPVGSGTAFAPVVVDGVVPNWSDLAPQADAAIQQRVDEVLTTWLEAERRRGVAHPGGIDVAVVRPGKFLLTSGMDAEGNATERTVKLEYASITKSFTAALLLRAVEDGRITMDEPIGSLTAAPWFTLTEQISLRDLLTHRSGLVNYADTEVWKRDWQSIDGWESALRAVEAEGLRFQPGSKVQYSSSNYIVAGVLVGQLYKRPVESMIRTDLLEPLGLGNIEVGGARPGAPGTGTGNMRGSVEDLARWAIAMWRDRVVLGSMGNNYASWTDPENLIGFGSFSYCPCQSSGSRVIAAGIGANGAGASVRYYRGTDTVVAVRVPAGMTPEADKLVADVLRAVQ